MKKIWLYNVLIVLITACSGVTLPTITPTPETALPTPLMAATNTPVIFTPMIPATIESSPTPHSSAEYQSFAAIIARMYPGPFYLLGGTENGQWLFPQTVIPHLPDGEAYQIFGLDGLTGTAKGKQPVFEQHCKAYQVETDSYPMGGRAVGVTGNWDVTPRFAQEIPDDHATYVEALKNWLVGQNILEPVVEISKILRIDLEGDGTEEVLISASHFVEPTGHSVEFGDYSLVVMRKVAGNSVVTIPIVADYYYQNVEIQFPLTYSALFVADLNNDGILEILVGVERWEGSGVIVYEVDGTNVRMVFEVICEL